MRVAILTLTIGIMASQAQAQWGLFGLTEGGTVHEVDELTGELALFGEIGVSVVDAEWYGHQEIVTLTTDDRIVHTDLRNMQTVDLLSLHGRPKGFEPVAFGTAWRQRDLYLVVLRPPLGFDEVFTVDGKTGVYTRIGSTGLSDVVGMVRATILTSAGGVYYFDELTGQAGKSWDLGYADTVRAITAAHCETFISGRGLYRQRKTVVTQISASGLEQIRAMVYSDLYWYANCDPYPAGCCGYLDIFDFLCFQNEFHAKTPYACDCDVSTGFGVCDIFDFLCFQNAYVAGVASGCG